VAKADGTYYEFFDLTLQKNEPHINGWEIDFTAGSGTCTATFLVSNRGAVVANALDQTSEIWGAASYTTDDGFVDNGHKLAGWKYVWWKFVLSTGGANDADFATHWVVAKG
jgi:hypothetical protein